MREDAKLHAGKQSKIIDAIVQCKGKRSVLCKESHILSLQT